MIKLTDEDIRKAQKEGNFTPLMTMGKDQPKKVTNIKDLVQQKAPTLDQLFHDFHTAQTQTASIMDLMYNTLKQNSEKMANQNKIIEELQAQINHIQPNLKKPKTDKK